MARRDPVILVFFAVVVGLGLLDPGRVSAADEAKPKAFRPPAVPLVACDPYFSVWSLADRLTDDVTRHWTGKPQALASMIRVDEKTYRLMGNEPKAVPALTQVGVVVLPTRTIYDFEGAQLHVRLTFLTPALPHDLDILSRPVTYLTWDVRSLDGKPHAVRIYFGASAELTVDVPSQRVVWSSPASGELKVLQMGSEEQAVLRKRGDDLRIDWGYAYAAAPSSTANAKVGSDRACSQAFNEGG
ncbi:DUF5127 domain-containing protein, partial [Singulisphaera rosea]